MKAIPILLCLTSPAVGQWVALSNDPVQCHYVIVQAQQCGPGGCCPPQQYYAPPQQYYAQPQRPRPQPIQQESPGDPGRPQFQPRPEPLVPVQPPPKEDTEENKKILAAMGENTKLLVTINNSIKNQKPCECQPTDLTEVNAKLDAIAQALGKPADPTPTTEAEQHVVIVADQNAPYWQRLSGLIQKTKETYSGVALAPPPAFGVGTLPQAVVYKANVPVRVARGQYEVEAMLSRLARNEPI